MGERIPIEGRRGLARLLEAALVLVLALFVFAPAILGDATIFAGDISVFESPRDRLLAEAWRAGEAIPRWTPGIAGGVSVRASQELGTLYPPTLLLAWFAPERAEALGLVLHLLLAALGARALARAIGLEVGSARIAGLAFGLSGSLVSAHFTPVYVRSSAWLPWAVAGLLRAVRGPPGDRSGILAAATALALGYLAGDPQLALVVAGSALVLSLGVAANRDPNASGSGSGRRAVVRVLIALAAAGALAMLLAAIQLVPAALAFRASERGAGLTFAEATRWSLDPRELVGALVPLAFGTHARPGSLWFPAISVDHERAWGESLYLGPLALALAVVGVARLGSDRRARAALALAALALLVALGSWTPFYKLVHSLPGGALFRYPAKLQMPAVLGVALLAALGFERLSRDDARARRLVLGALGVFAFLAVIGAGVAAQDGLGLAARIDAAAIPGLEGVRALAFVVPRWGQVALVALAGVGVVLLGARRPRLRAPALAAILALDLAFAARSQIAFGPREALTRRPELALALAAHAADGEPARVLPTESGERATAAEEALPEPARAFVAEQAGLAPNTGVGFGVFSQGGFLSNYPARLARLDAFEPLRPHRRAVLQGARFVIAAGAQVADYTSQGHDSIERVGSRSLVRLDDAPPWAAVYRRARAVPTPQDALALITNPRFDPRRGVVLETSEDVSSVNVDATLARLESPFEAHALTLAVAAPDGGWLVVREGWAEGWSARIDGGPPVAVVPADLLFRAVRLPPNAQHVVLDYVAPGEVVGELGTLVGLALVVAGLIRRRVPRAA